MTNIIACNVGGGDNAKVGINMSLIELTFHVNKLGEF